MFLNFSFENFLAPRKSNKENIQYLHSIFKKLYTWVFVKEDHKFQMPFVFCIFYILIISWHLLNISCIYNIDNNIKSTKSFFYWDASFTYHWTIVGTGSCGHGLGRPALGTWLSLIFWRIPLNTSANFLRDEKFKN